MADSAMIVFSFDDKAKNLNPDSMASEFAKMLVCLSVFHAVGI